ncbi:N-acetylglucosamine kinase [Pseudoalteromonas piscicida]|uniref:N-acetylglucosamine kinase n=1 Tax=Pseudoalteromonas piscicida TaxID=43662 RepID=A0AAQ2ET83_PSEO7|nr:MULTISPECIES: ROK family protein [Pseudoalteromonas]KJY86971.1 N-acetylglucosamine kinase [Pseudoalteromonas piscicida]MDP4490107.1 ROK family protein [Pseudoalteromonas piscicida]TMN38547.1 N-acetylglucosamine kinase [Pseudoalteromonas piscicida]TMN45054.1 N-acetylglucosamine kinase [Pseudoalteromonas piscicida]TMN50032.1 N-acetylglucosamine kinase [Pseudoalteromonas piscicida]
MIYGVDVGGSKIEIAVFDEKLQRIESWRVATPKHSYEAFLAQIVTLVQQADDKYGCKGQVGIGMPGIVNAQQRVLSANVPCANGKEVKADLVAQLERPIAVENDCRCFALSEASLGAGKQYQKVFGAIIGTGAGGGFCIDGALYKSAQGIAGEYGHHPLSAVLQQKYHLPILACGCGLQGCLERYVAGPGLAGLYQHFTTQTLTSEQVITAMRAGESEARHAFNCYMDLLGSAFANLIKAYDPEVIVLGGGMSLIDELVETLPKAIEPHVFSAVSVPDIVRAKHGDASGALGAALLGSKVHA